MKNILKFLITLLLVAQAHAEPVRIISNLPVGSAPDTVVRKLAEVLAIKWSKSVVIENRPGAAGAVALEYYVNEPANSNNILMLDHGAWSVMPVLVNKEDRFAKLQVLAPFYSNDWVIFTNSKIQTLADLRTAINNKPFYGSWGVGSAGHFCGLEVARILGVTITHVPYKEYGQWFADVVNSELAFSCGSPGSTVQYRNNGKLNWLAFTSNQRNLVFADVPTAREFFGTKFNLSRGQITFFINKTTPTDQIKQMQFDIAQALQTPEIKESIELVHGKLWTENADEFNRFIVKTINDNRQIIKQQGIQDKQ